jgi:hypothetical protein
MFLHMFKDVGIIRKIEKVHYNLILFPRMNKATENLFIKLCIQTFFSILDLRTYIHFKTILFSSMVF